MKNAFLSYALAKENHEKHFKIEKRDLLCLIEEQIEEAIEKGVYKTRFSYWTERDNIIEELKEYAIEFLNNLGYHVRAIAEEGYHCSRLILIVDFKREE